jgi:hypothetical protein
VNALDGTSWKACPWVEKAAPSPVVRSATPPNFEQCQRSITCCTESRAPICLLFLHGTLAAYDVFCSMSGRRTSRVLPPFSSVFCAALPARPRTPVWHLPAELAGRFMPPSRRRHADAQVAVLDGRRSFTSELVLETLFFQKAGQSERGRRQTSLPVLVVSKATRIQPFLSHTPASVQA